MVIQCLGRQHTLPTSARVIAIGEDPSGWDPIGEEIPQPQHAVVGRPRLLAVAVQAMDGNDTTKQALKFLQVADAVTTYSTTGEIPSASTLMPMSGFLGGTWVRDGFPYFPATWIWS